MGMLKYYWGVLRNIPEMAFRATDGVCTMLTLSLLVLIALAVVFNLSFGEQLLYDQWAGFDPIWISIATGAVVFCLFLRVIYLSYAKAAGERDAAKAELDRQGDVSHQLSRFLLEGQQQINDLQVGITSSDDLSPNVEVFTGWCGAVHEFLKDQIPEKVGYFDLELREGGWGYATAQKMQFRVDRLRYIKEWFDSAPALSQGIST